ncbi:MAG: hypothetical protein M1380_04000 [Chloroflexi bacterium]|nr:hypothetical protein [Chloroflexota bacterium]
MSKHLARCQFLTASGSVAGLGLLAACTPAAPPAPTAAPKAAEPKRGGTFRPI